MAETQTERTSGLELRDYFRILSQRKWTAIFVLLVVVGGALGGNAEAVERWVIRYQLFALVAVALAGMTLGARLWLRRSRSAAR